MANPVAVVKNEYYETWFIPETSSEPHPHPPLRRFRIITVSEIMPETSRIVLKWPSIESLAFFYKYPNEILPVFNFQCTLSKDEATRLIKDRVDKLDLCFIHAKSGIPALWLHDQFGISILDAVMKMARVDNLRQVIMSRIKEDQFYAIDYRAAPELIKHDCLDFQRVAWVRRYFLLHPYPEPMVEIRIPSMETLNDFMARPGLRMLSEFNRIFRVNISCARLFLLRIVPLELCFQMRMRRDFWINEFEKECFRVFLTAGAGAGAVAGAGTSGARTGGDTHVDDASDRAHASGNENKCFTFILTAGAGAGAGSASTSGAGAGSASGAGTSGAHTGDDAHVDDPSDRAHVSGADGADGADVGINDDATGGDFMNIG